MDTDEDRVAVGIGDCNAGPQWDKDVAIPGHYDAVPAGGQNISKTLRHVECHFFFRDALAGNSAAIMTSVPRIDDYGNGRAAARRAATGLRCRRIVRRN